MAGSLQSRQLLVTSVDSHALTIYITISIGNFLLAAAQAFFRSLPSAIFLFSSITNSQVCGPSFSFLPSPLHLDTGEHHTGHCDKSHSYYRGRTSKAWPFVAFT